MKFADRWLALIMAVVCMAVSVMLATSPMIPSKIITAAEAMYYRHWIEGGLVVIAIFFAILHFAVNAKKKP